MINYYVESNKYDTKILQDICNNVLSQVNPEDYEDLGSIYINDFGKRIEIFRGFKLPFDPMYLRKGFNGMPCITISTEEIYKKKKSRTNRYFLKLLLPFAFVLGFFPMLIWCIKDKNIHFWYIGRDGYINKKYLDDNVSRYEYRFVTRLLFNIGIHKAYDKYAKNDDYFNINIYEYAWNYRESIMKKFKWAYL